MANDSKSSSGCVGRRDMNLSSAKRPDLPRLSQVDSTLPSGIQHNDSSQLRRTTVDRCPTSLAGTKHCGPGSWRDRPKCFRYAEDDSDAMSRPWRQVDYLSHEWIEEDIWSSWRYVISKRHELSNSSRLENASWRNWARTRKGLGTVPPYKLDWYTLHSAAK